MDRQEREIILENFTADTVLFFEFLSQYPKTKVPQILKVNMKGGNTHIRVMFTLTEYNELKNYIKNNR